MSDTAAGWCGYHGRVDDCTKTGCSFCDGLLSHDPDRCSCCGRGHEPEPATAAPLACECCEKPLPIGTPAKMDRETGVVICNECFADLTAVHP